MIVNQWCPRIFFPKLCDLLLVLVLLCAGLGRDSWADRGRMEGILSAKGDTWIEVLDDRDLSHRFIPQWRGEGPANGGAFDEEMMECINQLVVGNRVAVKWVHDGHLRVLDADTLVPKYAEGMFIGYLLKTGKRWIDVQNIEEGKPWRFYLPWVGGYPSEGGGYDRQILRNLEKHNPTDPLRFYWKYRARPTVVSVYEKLSDSVTPFWVGKKLPAPKQIRAIRQPPKSESEPSHQPDAPPASPFDLAAPKPASPFDLAAPKTNNPFEQASPKPAGNPFDQSETKEAKSSPFEMIQSPVPRQIDAQVNPFENLPLPQPSPFELMNQK